MRGWQHRADSVESQKSKRRLWRLYNGVWKLLCTANGVPFPGSEGVHISGPTTIDQPLQTPTFGQRARGLVESLHAPASEMLGGPGGAWGNDKVVKLRGEKLPRVVFRLLLLYLWEATLDEAAVYAQVFLALLPSLLAVESEASKNRLHLFLWWASCWTLCSYYCANWGTLGGASIWHRR